MLKLISLFFIFESFKLIYQMVLTHPFDDEKLLHDDVCLGPLVCMFWLDWVLRDNLAKLGRIGVYINSPSQNHRARSLSSPLVYLDCVTGGGWLLLLGSLRISVRILFPNRPRCDTPGRASEMRKLWILPPQSNQFQGTSSNHVYFTISSPRHYSLHLLHCQ